LYEAKEERVENDTKVPDSALTLQEKLENLKLLEKEQAKYSQAETEMRNEQEKLGKRLEVLRREIAKDIHKLDRNLAYQVGLEYGMKVVS
jgi:uncharacterized FlaG/YvyC family protein